MIVYGVTMILRFLHLLGMASLVGGTLSQLKDKAKRVNTAMKHGAYIQLVTGLAMVAIKEPYVDHAKIGIKLLILLVIVGLLFKHKNREISHRLYFGMLFLTIFEVAVAVFL